MKILLLQPLTDFLAKFPAIVDLIGTGITDEELWWVKFKIDFNHPLSWHLVQELSCVINAMNVQLPTIFYPVPTSSSLNAGTDEFIPWVIKTKDKDFTPSSLIQKLETRLPIPINPLNQWNPN